jgi:hypothetical protein
MNDPLQPQKGRKTAAYLQMQQELSLVLQLSREAKTCLHNNFNL